MAPSLDTVGWFARRPAMVDAVRVVLTGRPPAPPVSRPPSIAVARTGQWDCADADSRRAVEAAAAAARAGGAGVFDVDLPAEVEALAGDQPVLMAFEAVRSLAWERQSHPDLLSDTLGELLDFGAAVDPAEGDGVRQRAALAAARPDGILQGADVLLTPAAVGEAPEGLGSTGDPRFARLWTLLGFPALAVPGGCGSTGLPVGVQLVARPGHDAMLVSVGGWLAGHLPPAPAPDLAALR